MSTTADLLVVTPRVLHIPAVGSVQASKQYINIYNPSSTEVAFMMKTADNVLVCTPDLGLVRAKQQVVVQNNITQLFYQNKKIHRGFIYSVHIQVVREKGEKH
eukprot:1190556-Prorocentrum_minimum.AAC.4